MGNGRTSSKDSMLMSSPSLKNKNSGVGTAAAAGIAHLLKAQPDSDWRGMWKAAADAGLLGLTMPEKNKGRAASASEFVLEMMDFGRAVPDNGRQGKINGKLTRNEGA